MPAPEPLESAIAAAVAASLSASVFQGAITSVVAEYSEYVDPSGEDFSTLRCFVTPGDMAIEPGTRGYDRFSPETQIIIGRRCATNQDRQALRVLRTEIVDMLRRRLLTAATPGMPANVEWARISQMGGPARDLLGMDIWMAGVGVEWITLN